MTLLKQRLVEKPWGKDVLPAPFEAPDGTRVGELWFEPPPELPSILVKYIFTSEKLSVQVHPDDAQAKALGEKDRGKEECWLVIDAEPGAVLGVGFSVPLDDGAIRKAALDGSIEELLTWYPVAAGDFFYIPAGTVHAIGAGISLIEIQQNSDITYRLYDYGRPRELHLDRGVAVARGEAHDPSLRLHLPKDGTIELTRGPFFKLWRVDGAPTAEISGGSGGAFLVVPLDGRVVSDGVSVMPGQCGVVSDLAAVDFAESHSCLVVREMVPSAAAS